MKAQQGSTSQLSLPVEFVLRPTNQLTNMPSYVSVRNNILIKKKECTSGQSGIYWVIFKNFILHSVSQFVYQLIFWGFKVNDEL